MILHYLTYIELNIETKRHLLSYAYSVSRYLNQLYLEFNPCEKVFNITTNAAMTLVSVNFRRGRKNPHARPCGNRRDFSPLHLCDNRALRNNIDIYLLSRNLFSKQKRKENRGELYREMKTPGMCVSDARASSENGQ